MPVFDRNEYLDRLAKTRQRMGAAGIDLLLVSEAANIYYLSGYDALSYYYPQFLIIVPEEEEPFWIGMEIDRFGAERTAYMQADRLIAYPSYFTGAQERSCEAFIAEFLREHGWHRRRIGLQHESGNLTHGTAVRLQQALAEAELRDAALVVEWVRTVKSAAEIAYLREAGVIADLAMQRGIEATQVDVRECDVAAVVLAALATGTPSHGGHHPEALLIGSGERASAPHFTWSDKRIAHGEMTNIHLGACRHNYHVPLYRTIVTGTPPAKLLDLARAVAEGMDVALDLARPGAICEEIDAGYRRVIGRYGYEKSSRIAYSLGIGFAGMGWSENTASFMPGDRTELQPNMVFHLTPGMWMDGWGLTISQSFRVDESGPPELFTSTERRLFVND